MGHWFPDLFINLIFLVVVSRSMQLTGNSIVQTTAIIREQVRRITTFFSKILVYKISLHTKVKKKVSDYILSQ